MTGLNFLERQVVVDMLWPVVKIDDDLSVAVWQEPIDGVLRVIPLVINEMIDKLIKREPRDVSLENHSFYRVAPANEALGLYSRNFRLT